MSSEYGRDWRSKNREKIIAYRGDYYEKNKERISLYHKDHRQKNQDLVDSYKKNACVDCGGKFPSECMDFDHRDPATKRNCVGTLVSRNASEGALIAEIEKCDLVCANCHRIRTHKRRGKTK